ncbi:MAG: glycosyltransferase family 4 protein [Fimbriimonadales bacterium]|nr:glycosyltransferase family 4 protein [Fimbriimonadales bacterium]
MRVAFLRHFHPNPWFSGAQIQALQTAHALQHLGVSVQFATQGESSEADLLHVFGLFPEYLPTVQWYQRRGTPVVVSPIFFKDVSTWAKRLQVRWASYGGRWSSRWRVQRALLQSARLLLPNTRAEAEQVRRYFRVATPAVVVPNGVDARFAEGEPRLFREAFGIREDFVLCVGRIERRKNQLRLVQALRGTGIPLVIVGECIARKYLARCQRAADANVYFLPALSHDSPLLASAYAACRVFALPSLLETPGLAALEAGVAGARIIVTPHGGAPDYFQQFARYPNPRSVDSIRAAILDAWDATHDPEAQRQFLLNRYSWTQVAHETLQAYQRVLLCATP